MFRPTLIRLPALMDEEWVHTFLIGYLRSQDLKSSIETLSVPWSSHKLHLIAHTIFAFFAVFHELARATKLLLPVLVGSGSVATSWLVTARNWSDVCGGGFRVLFDYLRGQRKGRRKRDNTGRFLYIEMVREIGDGQWESRREEDFGLAMDGRRLNPSRSSR